MEYLQGVPLVQGSPLVPEVLEAPAVDKQTVSAALCLKETNQRNSNRFKGLKNYMWTIFRVAWESTSKLFDIENGVKWWWNAKTKLWAQSLHYPATDKYSERGVIKILWGFSNYTVVFKPGWILECYQMFERWYFLSSKTFRLIQSWLLSISKSQKEVSMLLIRMFVYWSYCDICWSSVICLWKATLQYIVEVT